VRVLLAGASFPSRGKKSVRKVIERYISSPVEWITTPKLHRPLQQISHSFFSFSSEDEKERVDMLVSLLKGEKRDESSADVDIQHLSKPLPHHPSQSEEEELKRGLVFVNEVKTANRLSEELTRASIPHLLLHKNVRGKDRSSTLQTLRESWIREGEGKREGEREKDEGGDDDEKVRVVVTTDLLSRGIDLKFVSHVINFDFPLHATDFLHRCGRTARAGENGTCISFVTPKHSSLATDIKNVIVTNTATTNNETAASFSDLEEEEEEESNNFGVFFTRRRGYRKQKKREEKKKKEKS